MGGDGRVTEVRAWVVVVLSDRGTAHGATFGLAHPHNIRVIKPNPLSALEAEYLAVLRVLETVPGDLTLYIVCSLQCHTNMLLNLDTWSMAGWKYWDGTPIPAAVTLRSLHDVLHNREGRVHWRVGTVGQRGKRLVDLMEILRVELRLFRPPDPLLERSQRQELTFNS